MRRVSIITLGCARNSVDSEKMAARLRDRHFIVTDPSKADILIINTCGFITDAKRESLEVIQDALAMKERGKIKKVIVWGCLAQRYASDLLRHLKGIDAIVGVVNFEHAERVRSTPPHLAYLKIAEGCKNHCAYCAIPHIRGPLVSRPANDILEEVRILDDSGVKELIIAAQDTTAWGRDNEQSKTKNKEPILTLLQRITKTIKNIEWVRVMYAHPRFTTKELIDFIANEPKLCSYIDLPIQHINDRILKVMNRHAGRRKTEDLLWYIKKRYPNFAVRTTVIAGFPTETKSEFEELCAFIREYEFRHLGAFIYSKEEGTPAAKLRQVPEKVRRDRFEKIMLIQQEISYKLNDSLIGSTQRVLIDECRRSTATGRMYSQAHEVDGITIVKGKVRPGTFANVRITEAGDYDLIGKL
jgi:ribosomal protein S12 methylthiotransferase